MLDVHYYPPRKFRCAGWQCDIKDRKERVPAVRFYCSFTYIIYMLLYDKGWLIEKDRGKGGHWWFRKDGHHPFPISDVIGKGLQERIKKWLGIK